jgi:hypothetical protein
MVDTPRPRVDEAPGVDSTTPPSRPAPTIDIDRAPQVDRPEPERPTPAPTPAPSTDDGSGPPTVEPTRVEGPGIKPPVTDDGSAEAPAPSPSPSTEAPSPSTQTPAPTPEPEPEAETVSPEKAKQAREYFREAIAAHRKRNLDSAAQLYEKAIAADPRLVEAMVNLAGLRVLQRDYVAAEIYYRQAVGVDPSRTTALFGLGRVQLIRGNSADAHGTLGRLLSLNPRDAAAWVLYGDASWGVGNKDEALKAWQTAADRAPDGPIKTAAGQRLAKYGASD